MNENAPQTESRSPIAQPPYFGGAGWLDLFRAWLKANVPAEYVANIESEGMITWNRFGGSPSQAHCNALRKFLEDYNAGKVIEFPGIAWNNKDIAKREQAMQDGTFKVNDGTIYDGK